MVASLTPGPTDRTAHVPEPVRVLLVDDHPVTRQGLKAIIDGVPRFTVAAEADTAASAAELARKYRVHLVVLDISLRSSNGIDLVHQLKKERPEAIVLVMSMHDESLFAERAIRAGAAGYLMKAEASEKLIPALTKVLKGEIFLSDAMTARLVGFAKKDATAHQSSIETLSDRERQVFGYLGEGLSTRAIAEKLQLSVKTVDTYRENLKAKLDIATGSELVSYAIKWSNAESTTRFASSGWNEVLTELPPTRPKPNFG